MWPKTTRGASVPSSSSASSSPAARARTSARRSAASRGRSACPRAGRRTAARRGRRRRPAPSASRAAATAPGTTALSGAASGSAVQRSPLPRIQLAALELAQPRDGLRRPAAEQRVVAAEDPALAPRPPRRRRSPPRAPAGCRARRRAARARPVCSIGPVSAAPPPHEADPLVVTRPDPVAALRPRRGRPAPVRARLRPGRHALLLVGALHGASPSPRPTSPSLAGKRERGELLDFLIVHHEDGPIGVTGLSELSARNRHATVGSWFGHRWWGSGANLESKALIAALAFERLGMDRLTAWANTRNGRSQVGARARRLQARGRPALVPPPRRRAPRRRRVRHGAKWVDAFSPARGTCRASRGRRRRHSASDDANHPADAGW